MLVLFDQGTPLPLRTYLAGHTVVSAFEKGWSNLENGELLAAAESEGIEVLITTDQNLQYQQNLTVRRRGLNISSSVAAAFARLSRRANSHVALARGSFDKVIRRAF